MKKSAVMGILLIILLSAFLFSAGCLDSSTETTSNSSLTTSNSSSTTSNSSTTPTSSAIPLSVAVATDKTQYVRGEIVKLKVTNNLDISIWYIGYTQRDLVFWELERAQSDGWQSMDFRLPVIEGDREACRIILYEQPVGVATELKPHSDLLYEWNQKICPFKTVAEPFEPEMIERGKYRFAFRYSLVTVKPENIEAELWKRPIDLDETKVVYSNEFVLE